MEPIINEHGVIVNYESKKIVDEKDGKIEIHHIEHNGKIYATIEVQTFDRGNCRPLGLDDEVLSINSFILDQIDWLNKYFENSGPRNKKILENYLYYCNSLKQQSLF